jgi:predicted DNA-binding protein with PD1-like motif
MKAVEGKIGRVFVLRLENGDVVPSCIERFAAEKSIETGHVILIGGVDCGEVVVGPRKSDEMPPDPMLLPVDGAHEVAGVGIIAPDKDDKPVLHIHAALGRAGKTLTGCLRKGVTTWLVGEAIIYEITGVDASRLPDEASGFNLMEIKEKDTIKAHSKTKAPYKVNGHFKRQTKKGQ